MSGVNNSGNTGGDDRPAGSNNGVNGLVIGLNKSFQTLNIDNGSTTLSLSPHRAANNNTSAAADPSVGDPQIATTASATSAFKAVVPNKTQRPRALSPLSKEKQRVSFAPTVVEVEINESNVNNENKDNNNNNNNNDTDINTSNNSDNSSSGLNNNNNNNSQLNSQNINIFLNSLSNVSNDSKMKFNKLSGSASEIFQFDEECEEEMENTQNQTVIREVEMADDDDDQPNQMTVEGGNRSRSNGIVQELKLGTSLPMEIPSNLAMSLQKNSVAAMDFSYNQSEKKKYVTPRQSWVDTLNNTDDISMSFAVPLSLSRKSKSYI